MRFLHLVRLLGASAAGLLTTGVAHSQAAPDSARPPTWVLRGGLRLTHFSYSRSRTNWQVLVPAAASLEYRLSSRFSLYTQLDADVQLSKATTRRTRGRRAAGSTMLPAAAFGLGGRYYYGRPAGAVRYLATAPEFGKYLALEGGGSLTQSYGAGLRTGSVGRSPTWNHNPLLSPYLFVRWGIQNRLRPHLLYDLNAGLGLVAPARATAEYTGDNYRLDVAAQVNISLYLAR